MVPLEVVKDLKSSLEGGDHGGVGNRLQWPAKAAYQTSTPLCLDAGIR